MWSFICLSENLVNSVFWARVSAIFKDSVLVSCTVSRPCCFCSFMDELNIVKELTSE